MIIFKQMCFDSDNDATVPVYIKLNKFQMWSMYLLVYVHNIAVKLPRISVEFKS